jgi:hypothetical protein
MVGIHVVAHSSRIPKIGRQAPVTLRYSDHECRRPVLNLRLWNCASPYSRTLTWTRSVAVSGCWASVGPSDTRWTITTSNPSRYSRRTKDCGHWEDRVVVRYINSLGARRRPSSHALPSHPVFHETPKHIRDAPGRTHSGLQGWSRDGGGNKMLRHRPVRLFEVTVFFGKGLPRLVTTQSTKTDCLSRGFILH